MIGWLVHDDEVRLLPGEQRERDARPLPPGQGADLLTDQVGIETETTLTKNKIKKNAPEQNTPRLEQGVRRCRWPRVTPHVG